MVCSLALKQRSTCCSYISASSRHAYAATAPWSRQLPGTCRGKAKKNLVFRATVLKSLGRVKSFFLRIETSIIKTPTKKHGIFVEKVQGRPVLIGRVGLPETQDFFQALSCNLLIRMLSLNKIICILNVYHTCCDTMNMILSLTTVWCFTGHPQT